jgi:hypothetical protein
MTLLNMEVTLTKEDWEEAKKSSISLLKNAMAQVIVYRGQLETAERELAKLEEQKV